MLDKNEQCSVNQLQKKRKKRVNERNGQLLNEILELNRKSNACVDLVYKLAPNNSTNADTADWIRDIICAVNRARDVQDQVLIKMINQKYGLELEIDFDEEESFAVTKTRLGPESQLLDDMVDDDQINDSDKSLQLDLYKAASLILEDQKYLDIANSRLKSLKNQPSQKVQEDEFEKYLNGFKFSSEVDLNNYYSIKNLMDIADEYNDSPEILQDICEMLRIMQNGFMKKQSKGFDLLQTLDYFIAKDTFDEIDKYKFDFMEYFETLSKEYCTRLNHHFRAFFVYQVNIQDE